MKNVIFSIVSWVIALWAAKVFLFSIPYKFSAHPDTQHIFGTIGDWLTGFLGETTGSLFADYGAYLIGSAELLTSLVLLSPVMLWFLSQMNFVARRPYRSMLHCIGGLMASGIMAGAVFFHLFSPLGIEVLHEGKSDNGSLFYAALSIFILGFALFLSNLIVYQTESRQLK